MKSAWIVLALLHLVGLSADADAVYKRGGRVSATSEEPFANNTIPYVDSTGTTTLRATGCTVDAGAPDSIVCPVQEADTQSREQHCNTFVMPTTTTATAFIPLFQIDSALTLSTQSGTPACSCVGALTAAFSACSETIVVEECPATGRSAAACGSSGGLDERTFLCEATANGNQGAQSWAGGDGVLAAGNWLYAAVSDSNITVGTTITICLPR